MHIATQTDSYKAQTPLGRFLVDVLYKQVCIATNTQQIKPMELESNQYTASFTTIVVGANNRNSSSTTLPW